MEEAQSTKTKSKAANWIWGILVGIALVLVGRQIYPLKTNSERDEFRSGSVSDGRDNDRVQEVSDQVQPLYDRMRTRYGAYVGGRSNISLKPGNPWVLVVQPEGSIDYQLKEQISRDWSREWNRSGLWRPGDPEVTVDFDDSYRRETERSPGYSDLDERERENIENPPEKSSESDVKSGEDIYQQQYGSSRERP